MSKTKNNEPKLSDIDNPEVFAEFCEILNKQGERKAFEFAIDTVIWGGKIPWRINSEDK